MKLRVNILFKKLHLWIGLPGAIIFFFICFTGSLFVFADEIMALVNKPYTTVDKVEEEWIPVEQMMDSVQTAFPGNTIVYITTDKAENSSFNFMLMGKEGLQDVFVNPYDGKIIGHSRIAMLFFLVAHLHSMLLWHGPGGWIIKIATLLFIFTLITGLIIWWPKRNKKNAVKNAFTYKSNTPYKRRIFDWHRVWGFYGLGILLFLSITGTILAFEPLSSAVSRAAGGNPALDYMKEYPADSTKNRAAMGEVFKRYLQQPGVEKVRISLFFLDKTSGYRLLTGTDIGIITNNGETRFINQYSGEEIVNQPFRKDFEFKYTLMRLHTGKYWGWFGLIITFLGGLLGAFLSVTGVLLWVQRVRN